jgi:TolB protein
MSSLRKISLVVLVALSAFPASAQLVIRKSGSYNVHVEDFGGDTAGAAAMVRQQLQASGQVQLAAAGGDAHVVRANCNGAAISGILVDPRGQRVLAKSYATPRADANAAQFAQDILASLSGQAPAVAGTIAFSGGSGRAREIFIVQADGSGLRQVTGDGSLAVSPAISPDAGKIAFTSYATGYPDVHLVDLRSGSRKRVFSSPGTNTGAAFSPDGSKIALSMSFTGNPEIYVGGLGGGAKRITQSPGVESSPTWSPDGRRIAYVSDAGGRPQIYITGAGGGGAQPVRTGHNYATEPSWSPDGSKLAMTVRAGGLSIAVLDLASGRVQILGGGEDPTWGPDSRHLAFVQGGTLAILDTVTGQRRSIVSGRNAKEPSWSR